MLDFSNCNISLSNDILLKVFRIVLIKKSVGRSYNFFPVNHRNYRSKLGKGAYLIWYGFLLVILTLTPFLWVSTKKIPSFFVNIYTKKEGLPCLPEEGLEGRELGVLPSA